MGKLIRGSSPKEAFLRVTVVTIRHEVGGTQVVVTAAYLVVYNLCSSAPFADHLLRSRMEIVTVSSHVFLLSLPFEDGHLSPAWKVLK